MITLKSLRKSNKQQLLLAKFILNAYVIGDLELLNQKVNFLLNEVVNSLLESNDPLFKNKRGREVRKLSFLIVLLNTNKTMADFRRSVSKSGMNLNDFYLQDRQYYAAKKNLLPAIEAYVLRLEQIQWKKVPPARYIGVGYKDSGSRKNSAHDGSPSWQEVASDYSRHEDPLGNNTVRKVSFGLLKSTTTLYDDSYRWLRLMKRKLDLSFG